MVENRTKAIIILSVLLLVIIVFGFLLVTDFPFEALIEQDDSLTDQELQELRDASSMEIVSCPTGYFESHLDVFTENNGFFAIPVCSGSFGFLDCGESVEVSQGMFETVVCVMR